jgi:hypothetical protein
VGLLACEWVVNLGGEYGLDCHLQVLVDGLNSLRIRSRHMVRSKWLILDELALPRRMINSVCGLLMYGMRSRIDWIVLFVGCFQFMFLGFKNPQMIQGTQ